MVLRDHVRHVEPTPRALQNDILVRSAPPRTGRYRAIPRRRGPTDTAANPRQAEADHAPNGTEAGRHPPRRFPRPPPRRAPKGVRRGLAGGNTRALGGAAFATEVD